MGTVAIRKAKDSLACKSFLANFLYESETQISSEDGFSVSEKSDFKLKIPIAANLWPQNGTHKRNTHNC